MSQTSLARPLSLYGNLAGCASRFIGYQRFALQVGLLVTHHELAVVRFWLLLLTRELELVLGADADVIFVIVRHVSCLLCHRSIVVVNEASVNLLGESYFSSVWTLIDYSPLIWEIFNWRRVPFRRNSASLPKKVTCTLILSDTGLNTLKANLGLQLLDSVQLAMLHFVNHILDSVFRHFLLQSLLG